MCIWSMVLHLPLFYLTMILRFVVFLSTLIYLKFLKSRFCVHFGFAIPEDRSRWKQERRCFTPISFYFTLFAKKPCGPRVSAPPVVPLFYYTRCRSSSFALTNQHLSSSQALPELINRWKLWRFLSWIKADFCPGWNRRDAVFGCVRTSWVVEAGLVLIRVRPSRYLLLRPSEWI